VVAPIADYGPVMQRPEVAIMRAMASGLALLRRCGRRLTTYNLARQDAFNAGRWGQAPRAECPWR